MKIFYLVSRIPYPIDKGDKLRAFHQIKNLSQDNEIFLYALNEEGTDLDNDNPLFKYCKKIKVSKLSKFRLVINLFVGLFKNIPLQTSYFYSRRIKNDIINEINSFKPDLIYCQLIRLAEYVKDIQNQSKIIDYVDVLSKGLERRVENSPFYLKPIIKIEKSRVIEYEEAVQKYFDKSIIITEEDKNNLPFLNKSKVEIVPNGIDKDYYSGKTFEKKYDLMFSGNMSYPPNIDAALFLAHKIVPLLIPDLPKLKVLIVGATPSYKVLNLASENIEIKSWVDDIRECYASSSIYVAPMQLGTGLQNKLLEAMMMKIPCVTSKLAHKGIKAEIGKEILVASEPYEYVESIKKLLSDNAFAESIAENGQKYVKQNFDWKKIAGQLQIIFDSVVK